MAVQVLVGQQGSSSISTYHLANQSPRSAHDHSESADPLPDGMNSQEPETIRAWQQAFGFKRLNQRQLRQLQASVPPVNYYEESVLLTKVLAKKESQKQEQQ